MQFEWKHFVVEEGKEECSATIAGAPLDYFETRYQELLRDGFVTPLSLLVAASKKSPDALAVIARDAGKYKKMAYKELLDGSRRLAQGLIEGNYCTESIDNGIKMKMVAIFLDDCLECFVVDFAAQYVPAVTVFLHARQEDSLSMGLNNLPFDTIITNARYAELIVNLMEQKKSRVFRHLVLTEQLSGALQERLARLGVHTVLMSQLQANTGEAVSLPQVKPTDPVTMLWTSGSTGHPKLILAPNRLVINMFAYGWGTFLPPGAAYFFDVHYSYSSPRLIAAGFLVSGNPIILGTETVADSLACFKELNPMTALYAPMYLIKIYEYARKVISEKPKAEAERLNAAIEKKIAFVRETQQLHNEALDRELQDFRTQIFGTGLKVVFWTGTPLSEELRLFFQAVLGSPMLGLYGQLEVGGHIGIQEPLSESTIIGHITPPYLAKLLSRPEIGYTVDDIIDGKKCPRGELMVKGPVCITYYTKDADFQSLLYKGEWFRTNDIMQLDLDTLRFRLLDRGNSVIRSMIGHYIPVAEHERLYERSSYVRQVCVYVQTSSPSILAIIVPKEDAVRTLAISKGVQGDLATVCQHEAIGQAILADVRAQATKANIDPGKQVIGVILTPTPFSVENGLLTATCKIRRNAIYAFYQDQILALRKQLENIVAT
jgi:long-subunit acyl-CoA synthetase (AMP-forming)